tara:strand:+ start:398 stop:691 length:294 start_codon:yes stop_codon:yes gene_type:complete
MCGTIIPRKGIAIIEQRYTEARVIFANVGEYQATRNDRLAQLRAIRGAEGASSINETAETATNANVAGRPRIFRVARDHGHRKITMTLALRFNALSS